MEIRVKVSQNIENFASFRATTIDLTLNSRYIQTSAINQQQMPQFSKIQHFLYLILKSKHKKTNAIFFLLTRDNWY